MKKIPGFMLLFGICFLISNPSDAQQDNFDTRILRKMQEHRTDARTSFYKFISGSTGPVSFATPLTFFVTGMMQNNIDLKKKALFIMEGLVISQVISFSTKAIVGRNRPSIQDPTLIPLKNVKTQSFPSGHTTAAFATATSLAIIYPKWYIIVPAYTWASLVGYSRLYLGVHYPTDILGGAILGSGSAWLSYKLNKWMHSSKKKTKPEIRN